MRLVAGSGEPERSQWQRRQMQHLTRRAAVDAVVQVGNGSALSRKCCGTALAAQCDLDVRRDSQ